MLDLDGVIELAQYIHRGQTDKAGRPYTEHLSQVAAGVAAFGHGAQMVGWLHDSVEDQLHRINLGLLTKKGVPSSVVDAVDCLTKRKGEMYSEALRRVIPNYTALLVKLADNASNSMPERLLMLQDEETRERLNWKYTKARDLLLPHVAFQDAMTVFNRVNPELTTELVWRRGHPGEHCEAPRLLHVVQPPSVAAVYRERRRLGLWRSR